jgi:hypothetical protein
MIVGDIVKVHIDQSFVRAVRDGAMQSGTADRRVLTSSSEVRVYHPSTGRLGASRGLVYFQLGSLTKG